MFGNDKIPPNIYLYLDVVTNICYNKLKIDFFRIIQDTWEAFV